MLKSRFTDYNRGRVLIREFVMNYFKFNYTHKDMTTSTRVLYYDLITQAVFRFYLHFMHDNLKAVEYGQHLHIKMYTTDHWR